MMKVYKYTNASNIKNIKPKKKHNSHIQQQSIKQLKSKVTIYLGIFRNLR